LAVAAQISRKTTGSSGAKTAGLGLPGLARWYGDRHRSHDAQTEGDQDRRPRIPAGEDAADALPHHALSVEGEWWERPSVTHSRDYHPKHSTGGWL
jgi:hypothetical protein